MEDKDKNKEQLINELFEMRKRISELEASETRCVRVGDELVKGKGFLENIFKSSADAIMVTDPQGNITMVNDAMEMIVEIIRRTGWRRSP